jgi:hypothetical protein
VNICEIHSATSHPDNLFELDEETVARIFAADGDKVDFVILMTTPKGNVVSLTARAAHVNGMFELEIDGSE